MPTGTVKWFNTTKGFGFSGPDDGTDDALVHISALERSGLRTLGEGERVRFEPRPGRDGRVSAEDISLLAPADDAHQEARGTQAGTIKWFNTTKGFGFIEPDDGSNDVFVHAKAVERAGLGTLRARALAAACARALSVSGPRRRSCGEMSKPASRQRPQFGSAAQMGR